MLEPDWETLDLASRYDLVGSFVGTLCYKSTGGKGGGGGQERTGPCEGCSALASTLSKALL